MFKVYVGNLDSRVTADVLRPLFEPFGDLDEIIVATDAKTQKPRGFAIVLFRDPMKGQLAIETLAGRRVNGRTIVINEAVKRGKAAPGAPAAGARRGPFGPRFGAGAQGGAPTGRRFSHRNPRRGFAAGSGGAASGGSAPGEPRSGAAPGSSPPRSPPNGGSQPRPPSPGPSGPPST